MTAKLPATLVSPSHSLHIVSRSHPVLPQTPENSYSSGNLLQKTPSAHQTYSPEYGTATYDSLISTPISVINNSLSELPSLRYTQSPAPVPSFASCPSLSITKPYRLRSVIGEETQICWLGGCLLITWLPLGGKERVNTPAYV